MMVNCMSAAFYGLYMRRSIKRMDFRDFDSVFYNNIIATPILLLLSFLVEDWRGFLAD